MPQQDYTLLGIFVIVLIVFGVHVFLNNPNALELPKDELGGLEEVELAAEDELVEVIIGNPGALVGQAFAATCSGHKEAADEALARARQYEEKASSYNYDYLQFRAAKRQYEKSIDAYIACLG
tara:strand:- start:2814 stop:3182 length:369 start_codon:yes stop_codon:yes gene_type:complete